MPVINNGETLSAQKVNDYLNHTQLAPVAYTPTVSNATATASATYMRIGTRIEVEFSILFSGAASGTVAISTPTLLSAGSVGMALGVAFGVDGGVTTTRRSFTVVGASGAATVAFQVDSATSAGLVNATVPWTWANTDTIVGRFTYWEA